MRLPAECLWHFSHFYNTLLHNTLFHNILQLTFRLINCKFLLNHNDQGCSTDSQFTIKIMSSVIRSAFRDRTRKSSSTQDPTLARLSLNTMMTARQEPLDATLSAGDNVLSRLSFSKGYLHGLSSHFNRYQLIKAAVDVSTNDVVVPVRAVGRRTYKSNILALETWLSENLASVSTERVSPEAQRDLEVTIYCAIAAGIAAQRPSLFNVMSQVVDVLSHVSIGEADQLAANPFWKPRWM